MPSTHKNQAPKYLIEYACGHWGAVRPSLMDNNKGNCPSCRGQLRLTKPTVTEEAMRLAGYTYDPNLMATGGLTKAQAEHIMNEHNAVLARAMSTKTTRGTKRKMQVVA